MRVHRRRTADRSKVPASSLEEGQVVEIGHLQLAFFQWPPHMWFLSWVVCCKVSHLSAEEWAARPLFWLWGADAMGGPDPVEHLRELIEPLYYL